MDRKKIILGWSMGKERYALNAIAEFKGKGYDTVYCIAADDGETKPESVVFHDKQDAGRGIPAPGVDHTSFPPPSAEFLRSLAEEEVLALSMMSRFPRTFLFTEKQRLFHELVRYWDGVLTRYAPDAIVLSSFPHHLAIFVMYTLARKRGIPTLFLQETFVAGRLLMQRHYMESPLYAPDTDVPTELPDDLERFLAKHRARENTSPAYMKDMGSWFGFAGRLKRYAHILRTSLTDGSILERAYNALGRIGQKTTEDEYRSLVTTPDISVPYVYVPLHLQPESSTAPVGGPFIDQVLMVEILSNALPEGWLVYVKENPFQFAWNNGTRWNTMRYRGYYQKLAALRNVRLVPHTFDTFKLTGSAQAVATVTGTAALEALFRGIPALTFGYPWYMDMPGLLRVTGPDSVRDAVRRIKGGYRPPEGPIRDFLRTLHASSVIGSLDPLSIDPALGVSREETIPRIVAFLSARLRIELR